MDVLILGFANGAGSLRAAFVDFRESANVVRFRIPHRPRRWMAVFNSDNEAHGGRNVGNADATLHGAKRSAQRRCAGSRPGCLWPERRELSFCPSL